MEETRKPAKRARHSEHQEGTCIRISSTSCLKLFMFITYIFLTLHVFFLSCLMPGPFTSTLLGKGRDLPDISIISIGSSEK